MQSKVLAEEPIDYLEFGVRYGDSLFKWSALNSHPDSRFFGFDSFEGIPEDWVSVTGESKKGAMSVGGVVPQTSDPRIRFVKGWFNETLRPFLRDFTPRSRLIIHNDGDLFSSTLYTLATLDPILRPGSILIFDEFANPLHEWRAFHDYLLRFWPLVQGVRSGRGLLHPGRDGTFVGIAWRPDASSLPPLSTGHGADKLSRNGIPTKVLLRCPHTALPQLPV